MTTGQRRAPEAIVEGKPHLVVSDEDRDVIAELVADALLADLDNNSPPEAAL